MNQDDTTAQDQRDPSAPPGQDGRQPSQEGKEKKPGDSRRGRSTIDFPYTALDDAESIASAVHQIGGTSCDWNQLAAKLDLAPKGGGFRLRVSGARIFGLVLSDRGHVELTDLGIRILDPKHQRAARAEAFLAVPLYRQVFDQISGQLLPPPPALERMMETMGVAPKQKDKARQVFMRSAKTAGFFEVSSERLTLPPNLNSEQFGGGAAGQTELGGAADGADRSPPAKDQSTLHPFIRGLLDKLPEPETEWDVAGRAKWLTTAANIFDLMYTSAEGDGAKTIKVSLENVKEY